MEIDIQKKSIRKEIKILKSKVDIEDKKKRSKIILQKLQSNEKFINADTVMLYWSMDDEVFTHDFILEWYNKKKIILPCVKGDLLELREFQGINTMKKGENYGILEPVGEIFSDYNNIDIILVPGVAFDIDNNRMGRGKAYYDKLLKNLDSYKVGICFDFQLLRTVPTDKYDIKMDIVVSD